MLSNSIITYDDDVVVLSNNAILELPLAQQIPGQKYAFKSLDGTGMLVAAPGNNIDGLLSFSFSTPNESIIIGSVGSSYRILAGFGAGGGGNLEVQEGGSTETPTTTILNFIGAGVNVSGVGTVATIDIPGIAPTPTTGTFLDNVPLTTVTVGNIGIDGFIQINLSLFNEIDGISQSSYRVTYAVSPTGVDVDILQVDSNNPLTTVTVSGSAIAPDVLLVFNGSGVGATIRYSFIPQNIAR